MQSQCVVGLSESARKICKFVFGSGNEVDVILGIYFRHPTAIVSMKFSSMHRFGFAPIKFRKGLETIIQYTTVASSRCIEEFNSLSPREHLSKLYRPSF